MTPATRTYVTAYGRAGHYPRYSHIVTGRLETVPDGWKGACHRVIRGTESRTPPHPICPRCQRTVSG